MGNPGSSGELHALARRARFPGATRSRRRRTRARAGALLTCLTGLLLSSCAPPRPARAPSTAAGPVRLEARGEVRRTGSSWLRRAGPGDGLLIGRFEGAPYELGLSFGRLSAPYLRAQENHLSRLFAALIPSDLLRSGLLSVFSLQLRSLPRHVPEELLVTLAGTADGYEPAPPARGWPAYRRLLDMHVLHEVSQRFVDAPYLASYCTGFLARSPATRDGHVLLARNFDFEGGGLLDRDKVVSVVVPAGRIPYLTIGFPGMIGVVSGFNAEGLGVALQSIAGGETRSRGEPLTLLLADVLRSERTVEGALERVRRARVFVSDLVLLADASGRAVVAEKTPAAFAVREMPGSGALGVANEATDPEVRKTGLALPEGSTSKRREARVNALLTERSGTLDLPAAAAILRDRRAPSGRELGPGSRNAIGALISSHTVAFDLTTRRAIVATSPHGLGAFLEIDLAAVLDDREGTGEGVRILVPPDPFLLDGGYGRYRTARRLLIRARRLELAGTAGWEESARAILEEAFALSPTFVELAARLGEMCARTGRRERARELFAFALEHEIGPEPLRAGTEALRLALESGGALPPPGVLPYLLEPDELIEESAARDRPLESIVLY